MPPLPVITDVHRCAFNWHSFTSGNAVNVMHFRTIGGTATPADVFASLAATMQSQMWMAAETSSHIVTVDILPLDGVSATQTFVTGSGSGWTGGSTGDPIPAVAQIVKFSTGIRGRRNRGRIFVPFVGESEIAGGVFTTGEVGFAQAAWNTFLADLPTATPIGLQLVVASYAAANSHDVIGVSVERVAGTQRRRQTRLR